MLVLTRKEDESIVIDDEIEIVVVNVEGGQVRIGIEAPERIEIHRKEVYEQIKIENKAAAKIQIEDLGNIAKIAKKRGNEEKK